MAPNIASTTDHRSWSALDVTELAASMSMGTLITGSVAHVAVSVNQAADPDHPGEAAPGEPQTRGGLFGQLACRSGQAEPLGGAGEVQKAVLRAGLGGGRRRAAIVAGDLVGLVDKLGGLCNRHGRLVGQRVVEHRRDEAAHRVAEVARVTVALL